MPTLVGPPQTAQSTSTQLVDVVSSIDGCADSMKGFGPSGHTKAEFLLTGGSWAAGKPWPKISEIQGSGTNNPVGVPSAKHHLASQVLGVVDHSSA